MVMEYMHAFSFHFIYLWHQDLEGTLCLNYTGDVVYALLKTSLAVCSENFLLQVRYLGIPVKVQITLQIL